MASRDESHLFSLAALTTRSPAFPPQPSPRTPDTSDLILAPTDQSLSPHGMTPQSSGWSPLFPLGAPLGSREPLEPPPTAQPGRGRTIALVVGASLIGASIVAAAAWSGETAPLAANLGPEVSTAALAHSTPRAPTTGNEAPAPPPALEPALEPQPPAHATSASQPVPPASKPPRRTLRPPRPQSARDRGVATPAPAPARGPCSHCSAGDLACNIKCRASG